MATETLRPNAAGDETSIEAQFPASTFHWDKVDEASADDNTTYVRNPTNAYQRDLYALPASSGSGIINKITIHFRCWAGNMVVNRAKASIKSNSTITDGDEKTFADFGTWYNFTQEWTINPADSEAWEWSDINTLQIGISLLGKLEGPAETICTHVYVEVDYTEGTIPVSKTHQSIWNVRALVDRPIQFKWNVALLLDLVSKTLMFQWNVRAFVSDTLRVVFNIRSLVNKTNQYIWNVRGLVNDTLNFKWNVWTLINKSLQTIFNVRMSVNDTFQSIWHVRELVNDTVNFKWNVRALVSKSNQLKWNVLAFIWHVAVLTGLVDTVSFTRIEDTITFEVIP